MLPQLTPVTTLTSWRQVLMARMGPVGRDTGCECVSSLGILRIAVKSRGVVDESPSYTTPRDLTLLRSGARGPRGSQTCRHPTLSVSSSP